LQRAIHAAFGIDVLILDLASTDFCAEPLAVAEVLSSSNFASALVPVDLAEIPASALSEQERRRLEEIMHGQVEDPFSRIGWLNDAIAWLESTTGHALSSREQIEQYNAGYGFSLVRFRMDNGSAYWLKATGRPNVHEFAVTTVLANLGGEYLPSIVASRMSWNAWITPEEAIPVDALPKNSRGRLPFLRQAVNSLAALQIRTAGYSHVLFEAGAFDQRPALLSAESAAFFSYLEEAMAEQRSTNAPRIGRARLQELCHIFEDSCARLDAAGLPTTVIHGDMNLGNILAGSSHCQFIDWAETYVGSPLTTLQHLLLLNQTQDESVSASIDRDLTGQYRRLLLAICEAEQIDAALLFMPLVAAFSALYGRGDWLASPVRDDSRRQRYARTLARHIDRAAREPQLLSALGAGRSSASFRSWAVPAS
jgi:hypothetical protein